jgi:hypothetical protein
MRTIFRRDKLTIREGLIFKASALIFFTVSYPQVRAAVRSDLPEARSGSKENRFKLQKSKCGHPGGGMGGGAFGFVRCDCEVVLPLVRREPMQNRSHATAW